MLEERSSVAKGQFSTGTIQSIASTA